MPDRITITEIAEPESVEISLDQIEREALVGPDPEAPTPNTIAWRIHQQRLQVREGIVRARLHEKATERADMSPWLAKQAGEALGQARERLRQLTSQVFEGAMGLGQQLAAMRSEAIRNDRRLSEDGREVRLSRREAILDRLANLDHKARHHAVETDDQVAEAACTAPRWRLDQLEILPGVVSAAGDRLFQHRAPGAFQTWQNGRQQLKALAHEVRQAAKLAGTEITEEEITAAN